MVNFFQLISVNIKSKLDKSSNHYSCLAVQEFVCFYQTETWNYILHRDSPCTQLCTSSNKSSHGMLHLSASALSSNLRASFATVLLVWVYHTRICFSLSAACHASCISQPSHSPWIDCRNNIRQSTEYLFNDAVSTDYSRHKNICTLLMESINLLRFSTNCLLLLRQRFPALKGNRDIRLPPRFWWDHLDPWRRDR
jgi:hypothetical protein